MKASASPGYSIEEVSRDIGIGKDTLRVWERRYGFPSPLRNPQGERLYPDEQLERLRTISRLMDRGHRPGKVVPLAPDQLDKLAGEPTAPATPAPPQVDELISNVRAGRAERLKQSLRQMMEQQGPLQFILNTAAPLLDQTGKAWASGQLSIYMEHLITHHLSQTLHQASRTLETSEGDIRVLLSTLPGERHGMGLMMVELLLKAENVETLNLGVETPVDELIQACWDLTPQVLALSFSAHQKRAGLIAGLRELAEKIPENVHILVGGEGVSRLRSLPERVQVIKTLEGLAPAIRSLKRSAGSTP